MASKKRKWTAPHIRFVIEHDGLFPESGFGGCSCEDCDLLREHIQAKLCHECGMLGEHKMDCSREVGPEIDAWGCDRYGSL